MLTADWPTVGIDWADQKHDVFVHFANGYSYERKIDSRPEAIQEWLLELRFVCAEGKIAIALEQRGGALFYHLCTHSNWIALYPINPHSLASFRLTFFSSRAKDDPINSQLLEELVRTHAHNSRSQSLIEKRLQQIGDALNVTDDLALIEPLVLTTKCLVGRLRQFNQVIKELDHKIKELFKSHPDHFLFESLPGAGEQLVPRLLSLFGSDRSRWADATYIQKYSGVVPVIERSGKFVYVHRRISRPIFICQTFHEFAQRSVQRSSWADQYYRRQRERGKSHHSAIRALGFKWIATGEPCRP